MALTSGTRLGPYEILAPIGKGGMGEVYKAKDTRLDRIVAIKVLPEHLAESPERKARFEREAKAISQLNHPHICTLHDVGEQDGIDYLVMEYIEGPTLAERIAEGPIPVEEALPIARQMAEALEAGHEAGIIHRDLKPANVKVKEDGTVKVLDYGLAKALEGDAPGGADSELSRSPTLTRHGTQVGVILGTAAYMSPEQAKGKKVDKRADVWAFGAVLYEMLTGKKAFHGESVNDVIGSVLKLEPDWDALPRRTPAVVQRVLKRCLEKDPGRRLRDVGDARLDLDESFSQPEPIATDAGRSRPWLPAVAFLAGAAMVGLAWLSMRSSPAAPGQVIRLKVPFEDPLQNSSRTRNITISPDGRRLAYRAGQRVYVHKLDEGETIELPETVIGSAGNHPFFSPDGGNLAYFNRGVLFRYSLEDGLLSELASARQPGGGKWIADGTILFAAAGGIFELSGDGEPRHIIEVAADEEVRRPQPLPGSNAILYTVRSVSVTWDEAKIVAQVPGESERRVMVSAGTDGRYVGTGHLLYARADSLFAVPIDVSRLAAIGEPRALVGAVAASAASGLSNFDVSETGTLITTRTMDTSLVLVDREGRATPIEGANTPGYHTVRLSPDGRRAAVDVNAAGANRGLWVRDFRQGTRVLISRMEGVTNPVWSPDGSHLAFSAFADTGVRAVYSKSADGTGEPRLLFQAADEVRPLSWTRDGNLLTLSETLEGPTGRNIWVLSIDGRAEPFLASTANENAAQFSPDGRFIAYQSDESGRFEIYLQPFPGPGQRIAVSTRGGKAPVWSRDGSELFYRQGSALMVVSTTAAPKFSAGAPEMLFDLPYQADGTGHPAYDVFPDGEQFFMIASQEAAYLDIVLNWTEELKRLVPTDQ